MMIEVRTPGQVPPSAAAMRPLTAAADPVRAHPPLRSALYECSVMHHRLAPREHKFQHEIFMLALDLDELDEVSRRVRGFARNRRAFYEFRDRDHLRLPGLASPSLKDHVLAWIVSEGVALPGNNDTTRVTLVTLPRVAGYVFNPVSFYFVDHASTGEPICAVAEVGNTFGEQKPYLLRQPLNDGSFRHSAPKHFYVSPFSSLELTFEFKLRVPGDHLEIHVDEHDGGKPVLLSALTGRRLPLTTGRLWMATVTCPLVTLKVSFLIHWQALRLWLKRLPWHAKAAAPDLQRGVFNPHPSLSEKQP